MKKVALAFALISGAVMAAPFAPGQGTKLRSAPSSGGSAGVTSLGGQTDAAQTFAVGTSGTDFAVSSAGGTHTFNLPTASGTNRGALSSADWTTFNGKQASGSYITALTGEVTASGPGSSSATLSTTAVTGKALTGFSSGTGTVTSSDTILTAFNKLWAWVAEFKVDSLKVFISAPAASTVTLDQYAEYAYTINRITTKQSAGTVTAKLTIDGVDVTSCTSISVTSSEVQTTCTAANSVAVGNTVALVLTSPSAAADLAVTVKTTR